MSAKLLPPPEQKLKRGMSKSPLTLVRQIEENDQDSEVNKNQIEKFTFQNKKKKNFYSYKYNPNENTVFLNFDVKDFESPDTTYSQNILNYGVMCYKCTSQKKEPQQILIIQNSQNNQQFDVAYTIGQLHMIETYQYNQISELQEGSTFKLPRKDTIMHATYQNTLSLQIESQNLSVTLIFQTQEQRDGLWYGFQSQVIEYLCNQTIALNQQSLTRIFEDFKEQEPNKMMDLQDMQDFLRQIKVQSSKNQLQKYFHIQKEKEKDKKIDLNQVEKIVKILVDKSEVREIFKYYTPKEFLNCEDKTPCMSINDFRRFLFNIQKEDKDALDIQQIFNKLHKDKKNQISQNQPSHLISFQQFCKYIFSQKNTIFNPQKTEHYMDNDRPINDYYINCCRHFYSAKIDIESVLMIQKDKEGADFENKYLPIHFILKKGVRCASIDIWDGDEFEPVILYGYTMYSKVKLSDMLNVFIKYVFKENSNPFFLELDFHCQPAVMANVKKHIENIILPYLYMIPENYEEIEAYPTLYELQNKIILMGKLPFKIRNDVNAEYKKLLQFQDARKPDSIDDEFRNLDEQEMRDQKQKNENVNKYGTPNQEVSDINQKQKQHNSQQQVPKLKDHIEKKFDPQHNDGQVSMGNLNPQESEKNIGTQNDMTADGFQEKDQQKQNLNQTMHMANMKNINKIKNHPEAVVEKFAKSSQSLFDVFEISKNEYESVCSTFFPSHFNNSKLSIQHKESAYKGEDVLKGLQLNGLNVSQSFINNNSPAQRSNISNVLNNHSYNQSGFAGYNQAQNDKVQVQMNLTNTAAEGFADLRSFTQKHLMKVNPSGKKADANNFDPCLPIWQGIQFLMLSHHQFDTHSLLYSSFFQQNGGLRGGYILKPEEMCSEFKQESIKTISDIKKMTYYIKIISGSHLRSLRGEQVDPQVNVIVRQPNQPISQEPPWSLLKNTLWGIQDAPRQYQPTQVFNSGIVTNNNSNPIFEYEIKFSVSDPSVSFVIFNVVNTRYDNLIGWYSIPVNCIRQGYRIIPLKDENMNTIQNSCLLCSIKITQDI